LKLERPLLMKLIELAIRYATARHLTYHSKTTKNSKLLIISMPKIWAVKQDALKHNMKTPIWYSTKTKPYPIRKPVVNEYIDQTW